MGSWKAVDPVEHLTVKSNDENSIDLGSYAFNSESGVKILQVTITATADNKAAFQVENA